MHSEIPILCGEFQGVIAKLRQEGYSFGRLDDTKRSSGHHVPARSLFCLREPGLFVDVLQLMNSKELRKEAQGLMTLACTVREKLRLCLSNPEQGPPSACDIFRPLLDIVKSSSMSATVTGEALVTVHRMIADLSMVKCDDPTQLNTIIDSVVECVFRQTETGDDEIAIMWALEVLEACINVGGTNLSVCKLERVFVTIYKNSVASTNADMLRRLAVRKLSSIVSNLFSRLFVKREEEGSQLQALEDLVSRMFAFLSKRVDPYGSNWHDIESRQTCLELLLTAIMSTIDPSSGHICIDTNPEIHKVICDGLFRGLLQTCQGAGRAVKERSSSAIDMDMVKVSHNVPRHPAVAGGHPFALIPTTFEELEGGPMESRMTIVEGDANQVGESFVFGEEGSSSSTSSASGAGSGQNDSTLQMQPAEVMAPRSEQTKIPLGILSRALRIVHILIAHYNTRKALKVQIQAFYNAVFLRALETKSKNADNEARRLVLETLTDLFADPTIAVDLYCNFDCSLNCTNVYENLFVYLSNHSFPKQLRKLALDSLQLMSLRCIHIGVRSIASRTVNLEVTSTSEETELIKSKTEKKRLMHCANEFNRKPKHGISALIEAGRVSDPPLPLELAQFLRNAQGLDKNAIGQYLGSTGDLQEAVLESFVATFSMKGLTLLEGLRMFLESFRLPGEAQMIDRILQKFSEHAHSECNEAKDFATVDCTYLLCFSIILLNTDLHNPNIRPEKKMSFDAFKLNNLNYGQEVSQGKDMPIELLRRIYDEIKDREINTMSDGSNLTTEVTTDRWRDMLRSTENMLLIGNTSRKLLSVYDKQMFLTIHKPAFAALSVVYHAGDPTKQPKAVEMALEGIMKCAQIASFYGLIEVLDRISVDVCKFTSLLLYANHLSTVGDEEDEQGSDVIDGEDDDHVTDEEEEEDEDEEEGSLGSAVTEDDGSVASAPKPPPSPTAATATATQQQEEVKPKPATQEGQQLPAKPAQSVSRSASRNRDHLPDVLGSLHSITRTFMSLKSNAKAQTATDSVFEIARIYPDSIRMAWPHVVYCILRLFDLDLLPPELLKESQSDAISPIWRIKFHKLMAQAWGKEYESKLHKAKDRLEKSKGWVSWLVSGESTVDAEDEVRQREEEFYTVKRAIGFASKSLDDGTGGEQPQKPKNKLDRIDVSRLSGFIKTSVSLRDSTLVALVRGVILACCGDESICPTEDEIMADGASTADSSNDDDVRGDIKVDMLSPPSRASRLFGLQLLTEIVVLNIETPGPASEASRIRAIWKMVKLHLVKVLKTAKSSSCHVEKAVIGLIRVSLLLLFYKDDTGEDSESPGAAELREDAASTIRYLLRLPKDVAPEVDKLICLALVNVFDTKQENKVKWNAATSRVLLAISQLDDFKVACLGVQILRKVFGENNLVLLVPFAKELVHVCLAFFARSVAHHKYSGAKNSGSNLNNDDASEAMTDLLNLLFILHTKLGKTGASNWVSLDLMVLESLAEIAVNAEDAGAEVRLHAAHLVEDSLKELLGEQELTVQDWCQMLPRVLLRATQTQSCSMEWLLLLEDFSAKRNKICEVFARTVLHVLKAKVSEWCQSRVDVVLEAKLDEIVLYSLVYIVRFSSSDEKDVIEGIKQVVKLIEQNDIETSQGISKFVCSKLQGVLPLVVDLFNVERTAQTTKQQDVVKEAVFERETEAETADETETETETETTEESAVVETETETETETAVVEKEAGTTSVDVAEKEAGTTSVDAAEKEPVIEDNTEKGTEETVAAAELEIAAVETAAESKSETKGSEETHEMRI